MTYNEIKENLDSILRLHSLLINSMDNDCGNKYLASIDVKKLNLTSDTKWVQDFKGNNLLIFTSEWNINWALERNEGLILEDFSKD